MREKLLDLIPEFNLIEDADLREKTIRTWELAMEEGGWTLDDLARMPDAVHAADRSLPGELCGAHAGRGVDGD